MNKTKLCFLTPLLLTAASLTFGVEPSAREALRPKLRSVTSLQRRKAAARAAKARADHRIPGVPRITSTPGGMTDYFGTTPNFANSPLLRKFVDSLPGLGAANKNNLGKYLPVAVPDTLTYPDADYYEINLVEYHERMHSDLPATGTQLRGYVQVNLGTDPATNSNTVAPGPVHYLGPVIVAKRDRPVRIKFTNKLPTGSNGDLFIPLDTTVMGAGKGPVGTENYTQNRATLHLHGGVTPWISDGTPHQWITPAGETTSYPKGVSVQNVPDMPDPGAGSQTFFYTNQQSARLMFYHDHAYGITRLNVYAGEAAGYLLTDTAENTLIDSGKIPGAKEGVYRYGIPLIIQDKTFVPDANSLAAQDPTWNTAKWGGLGNLWLPHVYMPNQNPADKGGVNAMGRWDYGPWFWPPLTTAVHQPIVGNGTNGCPNGLTCPGTPNPSLVPEAFMDTPLVNGTAYPFMEVERKAYRFRILNASNDRYYNLQLYYVDPAHPTEVKMVVAAPHPGDSRWPSSWPTDGRDGGVPAPNSSGPSMIQIGTEGGFLPAPVVLPNTPIGYVYNRRDITVLNVSNKTLFLGPAERADVIVDFSQVPKGSKIILYNDSPAPVPGLDPRNDYYTGDPDQTSTGGAPTTLEGYGPNTRTILQFRIAGKSGDDDDDGGSQRHYVPAFDLEALKAAFASTSQGMGAFASSQPAPIVPEAAYGSAFNTTYPNAYSKVQDNSLTFTPADSSTPTTIPMQPKAIQELFELNYGRMNSTLGVELPFTNFNTQTTIPLGYTDPITENLSSSGTQLWKITHNGVDTHAIHFHLFNVQIINRVGWDGMIKPPDPNELGWKDTVRMNPLEDAIVALRPAAPDLPFRLNNSVRPLDPTTPIGFPITVTDPTTGNAITVPNNPVNFEWEYVWHCHLLGHEENDMMRPIAFQVSTAVPVGPTGLAGPQVGAKVNLSWTDNSNNEDGFRIERAVGTGAFSVLARVSSNVASYVDTAISSTGATYKYRIFAYNAAGDSLPTLTITVVTTPVPVTPPAPFFLTFVGSTQNSITISWTAQATDAQGFVVWRSSAGSTGPWIKAGKVNSSTITFKDTGLANNTTYWYSIEAYKQNTPSSYTNVVAASTQP